MSGGELAGALTERLTLLTRAPARDDLGGAIGGWLPGATMWAAIRPDGAIIVDQDAPDVAWRWRATVRTPCAVAAEDRVEWNGRRLRVRWVEASPAAPDRLALRLEEDR